MSWGGKRRGGGKREEVGEASSSSSVAPPASEDGADVDPGRRGEGGGEAIGGAPIPPDAAPEGVGGRQLAYLNGVTSLSWDRHGRTLLAGAIGDRNLRLMDNT